MNSLLNFPAGSTFPANATKSFQRGETEAKVYVPGTPVAYTPLARNITTIRIHYNVGYGNRITLCGDTDPFRWTQPMETRNTATDVWERQLERIPSGQTFQYKPLINDVTWSAGSNYTGTDGTTIDIYPTF